MNKKFQPYWTRFAAAYVPVDASKGQVRDVRAAFYHGAMDLFDLIADTPSQEVETVCQSLVVELKAFIIECRAEYEESEGEGEVKH